MKKELMIMAVLTMMIVSIGCGTATRSTTDISGSVQVAQTAAPLESNIVYINYSAPTEDYLKSIFQYTVTPGSLIKLYNNAALTTLVSQQYANSVGMFIFNLGDNVAANDTVYLVVVESGKNPSPAIAFTRP